MKEHLIVAVLGVGATLMFISALGVLRMPDLFSRMHASTKAGTMGVSCLMFAVAIHFEDLGISTRALLVIAFLFLTAPVAATMIALAAYVTNVPQWEGTIVDELAERQDLVNPAQTARTNENDSGSSEDIRIVFNRREPQVSPSVQPPPACCGSDLSRDREGSCSPLSGTGHAWRVRCWLAFTLVVLLLVFTRLRGMELSRK